MPPARLINSQRNRWLKSQRSGWLPASGLVAFGLRRGGVVKIQGYLERGLKSYRAIFSVNQSCPLDLKNNTPLNDCLQFGTTCFRTTLAASP